MYEFDCKPTVSTADGTRDQTWQAIAMDHMVGFVLMDSSLAIQTCQGSPQYQDTLTTSKPGTLLPSSTSVSPSPTHLPTTLKQISAATSGSTPVTATKTPITSFPSKPTSKHTSGPTSVSAATTPPSNLPQMSVTPKPVSKTFSSTNANSVGSTSFTTGQTLMPPNQNILSTMITPKPASDITTTKQLPSTTTTSVTSTSTQASTLPATASSLTTTPALHSILTTTDRPSTESTPQSTTPMNTPTTAKIQHQSTTITASPGPVAGNINLCPASMRADVNRSGGVITQYGSSCYELVPSKYHWSHAENYCAQIGGHLFHVSSAVEETFILDFLRKQNFGHAVWMGLNDINAEEQFEWSSGAAVTYTNWKPDRKSNFYDHQQEDCVVLVPYLNHGEWDDIPCGHTVHHLHTPDTEIDTHPFICQIGGIKLPTSSPQLVPATGDVHSCPVFLQNHAAKSHYPLARYGSSCYELVTRKDIWIHAEQYCETGRGNLLHILSAEEQAFVEKFLTSNGFSQRAVWMGLHDTIHEEQFQWTSGDPVTFTNWTPNRKYNGVDHNSEDCALFVPNLDNGHWDDVQCGSPGLSGNHGNEYPWVCQFDLDAFKLNQGILVGK